MNIETKPAPWSELVVLCRKCSRKLDGGFGPDRDTTLRSALRGALREQGRRRSVRIVETKCMGECPKRAVTMMAASQPGRVFIVPAGAAAADVIALLDNHSG